ncbi:hypothetical protein L9F63_017538, partial [Diploptera punctata]
VDRARCRVQDEWSGWLSSGTGAALASANGILYPFESESRNIRSLDGIWNFRLAAENESNNGSTGKWYEQELQKTGPTILMPVPASYNDITEEKSIRDHVGTVRYDRDFFIPKCWSSKDTKVWIRFGGVHYEAIVYINGKLVVHHEGGHIPFQAEVTSVLKFGEKNLISVAVNNTLTDITVPQGEVTSLQTDNGSIKIQKYTFDFFNYAGIHRPVLLYTTPTTYIDDIYVQTDIHEDNGIIKYSITIGNNNENSSNVLVSVLDRDGNYIIRDVNATEGELVIPQAKLWWPYLMDPEPAYLYSLQYHVTASNGGMEDIYRLPVGIRKLEWTNDTFTINGKPIYMRGFGRHEDSDASGRITKLCLLLHGFKLL